MREDLEHSKYNKLAEEVEKIDFNLKGDKLSIEERLALLNIMRYDLGILEDIREKKKVKYNSGTKELEYSPSIEIGLAIATTINEVIQSCKDVKVVKRLYNVMQETYYYLARYLFEYYLPAMEFGISPEKQFIAPRAVVLNNIAKEMTKFYYRSDRPVMTLSMPQGTGKEQPLSSKILTPEGWITMESVRIGTKVIGADGKSCNVIGVYPKGIKDVYRITFDDNTYVECGLEHLWEVRKNKEKKIVDTRQMLKDFVVQGKDRKKYYNYSVRLVKPVEYENSLCKDDEDTYWIGKKIRCKLLIDEDISIPKKYLYSSIHNRLKLLKGIYKGCGEFGKCYLHIKSKQLSEDIAELIRGLGGKVKITSKAIRKYGEINMLTFFVDKDFIRFGYKSNRANFDCKKVIVNIEKVRKELCQCIMVDSIEHLYVTDGYTLTHNTEISKRFMSWAIGKDSDLPNMMVSYSAAIAKDKFYNGVDAIINDDLGNYKKIFPNLRQVYKSGETLSIDYTDDINRNHPHSEYTLYCVGFDGSVTGRTRAHNILYADDLVKSIEEASNKDIMDKKWIEFTGTIKKRMQSQCKMLMVGTMFSINDPITRTIKYYREHAPERLIEIRIPGLNENDESNFNYKYGKAITTDMFHEDRNLMDPVSFSCLIQQEPIDRFGLVFYENEFKKYNKDEYERKEGYQRTVAACDVAWGGEDHLSMPIIDEYSNGDCPVVKWIFVVGEKEVTIPRVVDAIIFFGVTNVCFEANNGGDMYADEVSRKLKEKNYTCYVHSQKSPTTKSKQDRILANQAFIRGADAAEYRMIIPTRQSITKDVEFNAALNEIFTFKQSGSESLRKKQHDDAPDSAAMLASNVLGMKGGIAGKAYSSFSRADLGI